MSISRNKLDAIINALIKLRENADDETALETMDIYPEWYENTTYESGKRVRCGGKLYRCLQLHTSQLGWEPHNAPALWTQISLEQWSEWKQPTGAHDAYQNGDRVTYNGTRYISEVDSNVWAPDFYGWIKVS